MFNRIWYLVILKNNISDIYFHKYIGIEINSDENEPLENTLTIKIVVILIKSVF